MTAFRLLVLVFVWIAASWSSSCAPPKPLDDDGFKIALLTSGPVSDRSWNGAAFVGIEQVRDSLGARISHIQARTPGDFEENFRQYGAAGYALVIGHGFEFQDAAVRVAPEYPRTVFATTGGNVIGPNVIPITFAYEEPAFLAGMTAAALTHTGIIGCVGGTELPNVKATFAAFESGARTVRPAVRVLVAYLGSWEDVSAGREQALALAGRGTDIIFQDADAAGLGVFQAARERHGLRVIGANINQNDLAPAQTIGSVVVDVPHAFLRVARDVRNKTLPRQIVRLATRDGVVRWEPNELFADSLSRQARIAIDSVGHAMRSGAFTLTRDAP